MRLISSFIVVATLTGCGDKYGPVEPATVTPEEERQMQETQKKVDAEERQQMAQQNKNRPLTPEQRVEMEERAHQQGRR